jgi:hypothetical protein
MRMGAKGSDHNIPNVLYYLSKKTGAENRLRVNFRPCFLLCGVGLQNASKDTAGGWRMGSSWRRLRQKGNKPASRLVIRHPPAGNIG